MHIHVTLKAGVILGKSETLYVAMVTKLLCSYCEVEANISDANWLRYLSLLYLIKTWLGL